MLRFFQSNRNGTRQDQIQAIEKLRQAVGDLLRPDTPQDSTEGAAAQNEDPLQEPELISTRQLKLARNLHQNVIKSLTVYQSENERIADSFNEFLIWWMELESWLHDRSMPSRDALGTRFDPKSSNIRDWVGLAGFVELLCRIDPNPETRSTVDRYAKLRALLQDRATELANLQNLDEIAEFSGSAEGRQSKDVKTAKHTKALATATAKVFTK